MEAYVTANPQGKHCGYIVAMSVLRCTAKFCQYSTASLISEEMSKIIYRFYELDGHYSDHN